MNKLYTNKIFNLVLLITIIGELIFISVSVFAAGAGVLSGIFSVNESKEITTAVSEIHDIDL